MISEKARITAEDIRSQTVVELPRRELLSLVTIVIANVLNNLSINVDVKNVNIAVQICAVVDLINTILASGNNLSCTIKQG